MFVNCTNIIKSYVPKTCANSTHYTVRVVLTWGLGRFKKKNHSPKERNVEKKKRKWNEIIQFNMIYDMYTIFDHRPIRQFWIFLTFVYFNLLIFRAHFRFLHILSRLVSLVYANFNSWASPKHARFAQYIWPNRIIAIIKMLTQLRMNICERDINARLPMPI